MSDINQNAVKAAEIISKAARAGVLKKVSLSLPTDKTVKNGRITPIDLGGLCLQYESFHTDNKAMHKNIAPDDVDTVAGIICAFADANVLTSVGNCEYKSSRSGNSTVIGGDKLLRAMESDVTPARVTVGNNNRVKKYILSGDEPFLKLLDVSDANGRVHDKKQPKFRQINRFLELVRDIEKNLPPEGTLNVCDLCCGKSYLSFAVYHYFTAVRGRDVMMTGVDLKPDVVEYCNGVAEKLGWDKLKFFCGDIRAYDFGAHVNLVVSLHACDVATDIVLEKAMAWDADVILSTPCCHHELNKRLDCPALDFIADHSMLRQKLCDAATDAMRLKLLEANGYGVAALELIDPEETPKNIMLRGIRKKNFDKNSPEAVKLMKEYIGIREFLMGGSADA